MSHPCGHIPVDGAEVVALLILAHLRELDPLPAEHRSVVAGEEGVHQAAGTQLDSLDLPQHFGGDRAPAGAHRGGVSAPALLALIGHGTPTASRILAMTRSESMSSASASKVRSTR